MIFHAIPGQLMEILGSDGSPLMRAIEERFSPRFGVYGTCITLVHSGPTSLVAFVPNEIYGDLQELMRQTWEANQGRLPSLQNLP